MHIKFYVMIISLVIIPLISLYTYYYHYYLSYSKCFRGYFRISGMIRCHKLLSCDDMKDMKILTLLAYGNVKKIHLVKWNNYHIVLSNLTVPLYNDDFRHNIEMIKSFSPSQYVVQLIGSCNDTILFTEYHPNGDALNLPRLLKGPFLQFNNLTIRFGLCINYVKILNYLHKSPLGTRVMCDSNSLEKTLSQYLITNHLRLVVNDLDALPEVKVPQKIKCGHRQLFGSFVAPEQLWPFHDKPFSDNEMIEYDEKVDIWKIPDICQWFLRISQNNHFSPNELFVKSLNHIHLKCKNFDPQLRPSAEEVLRHYEHIILNYV